MTVSDCITEEPSCENVSDVENVDVSDVSEAALVSRARGGDSEAFAALAASYRRLVYWHVSRSVTGSENPWINSDDLFQEGLVGLLKAVRTYDGVSSSFSTYASTCIGNSVISAVRRYRRQSAGSVPLDERAQDEAIGSVSSPESDLIDRESSALLYARVLSGLSSFERSVFELYLSDHSYEEIAHRVGKPEKSVANAICRARRKLRAMLA